jgi:hypothetical protein
MHTIEQDQTTNVPSTMYEQLLPHAPLLLLLQLQAAVSCHRRRRCYCC